jgi:DNA-binding LacI/PurR family transcriptional regulator
MTIRKPLPGASSVVIAPERRRRPTSYDVAQRAGVSQSAVSRCFAEGASISPQTRARVVKAAAELGYRPNALAQGLGSQRTGLVAVLISSLGALYYPEVLSEITRHLYARDMRVLLFPLYEDSDVGEVLEQALRHRVDGVIAAAKLSEAHLTEFATNHVPLVLYNRVSHTPSLSSVCCDSAIGERMLVEGLLAAGHRHFAIIAGPADSHITEVRRITAERTLADAGLQPVAVERGGFTYQCGWDAMHTIAARGGELDALICGNDMLAIGAVDAARALGRRVPEELSVVGFDGSEAGRWASYQVTTFAQAIPRMTEAAVQMLVEQIDDPNLPPERRRFEGRLIAGKTARLS